MAFSEPEMFLLIAIPGVLAVAIAAEVMIRNGILPGSVRMPVMLGMAVAAGVIVAMEKHLLRKSQCRRYREAGFLTASPDIRSVDAFLPFPLNHSSGYHKGLRAWLPEAPDIHVYDIIKHYRVTGHLITLPTSAPDGVAPRGVTEKELEYVLSPVLYGSNGPLRQAGQPDALREATPLPAGVLAVWRGAGHWRSRDPLTPEEVTAAIAALRRLPPAGAPSSARQEATISRE